MSRLKIFFVAAVVSVVAGVGAVRADVAVSGLFSDHMVLQRDVRIPVWGTASPNEKIDVRLSSRKAVTTADAAGRWQVRLDPLSAGGPFELSIAGSNTLVLKDVLIGEVWLCSGQSNMAFVVRNAVDGEQEVAAAKHARIRLFQVPRKLGSEPQDTVGGEWKACEPTTVADFSAVGYFFGRELYNTLNVPIGLIDSSWGGTPAESWMARKVLEADPDFKSVLESRTFANMNSKPATQAVATRPASNRKSVAGKADARRWRKGQQAGRPAGRPTSRPANSPPVELRMASKAPSVLYNGMIHPLAPYAIRGAIWYQGEANSRRAYAYRKVLPAMIRNWRTDWGREFPFLIVQLSSFQARQEKPYVSDWAELREAQLMTSSQPMIGLAVTIDIGDPKDIHPRNKQEVGRRLSLAARAIAYGEKLAYSGPMYESHTVEGDKIRLRLKHADGGLAARGGGQLTGFAVAGDDRQFAEAKATIDGDAVIVASEKVKRPVAVRYAWGDVPACNLVNGAGLPASPFRTDDWPGITADVK